MITGKLLHPDKVTPIKQMAGIKDAERNYLCKWFFLFGFIYRLENSRCFFKLVIIYL